MKKQSSSSRMDEMLGMKRGKESSKKQSMKSRRDESISMKKVVKKIAKKFSPAAGLNKMAKSAMSEKLYPSKGISRMEKKGMSEKLKPENRMAKYAGKEVAGRLYPGRVEQEEYKQADMDNNPRRKPADVAQAMMRSKMGYSKKPRVKPSKK